MKNILNKILCMTAGLLLLSACSRDKIDSQSQDNLPKASDIRAEAVVNQATNVVTFKLNNPGCMPMWIFEDGSISSVNGATKLFVPAGEHSVEVKMMNYNGTSEGSVIVSFTLENTFLTDEMKRLSSDKGWKLDPSVAAHIGCGESPEKPFGWWPAKPWEKKDFGLYDDKIFFTVDGKYTYDPGPDKKIYVNKDSGYHPEFKLNDKDDYDVTLAGPIEATYSLDLDGLGKILGFTLKKDTPLIYVPYPEYMPNPKWMVTAFDTEHLELVAYNGGIAWHLYLVPGDKVIDAPTEPEEPAFEEGDPIEEAKWAEHLVGEWTWEPTTAGHFGCGPNIGDPTSFWSANPDDKKDFELYDDTLSFTASLVYIFNPGEGGKVFVNNGCGFDPVAQAAAAVGEDYVAAAKKMYSPYKIQKDAGGTYLEFTPGTVFSYIPSDYLLEHPKYYILKMTENCMELASYDTAISWKYRFKKTSKEVKSALK